ncbi:MAG: class B sortase [Lachnospiraceae bacterium]|nr:class B sortase [Lachnospiraceae bacterium]
MKKETILAILDRLLPLLNGASSLASMLLAAFLVAAGGVAIYDNLYTAESARSAWDVLAYKPEVTEGDDGVSPGELAALNPDYRAWLTIYDSPIDYPVVQGEDDLYYASHDVFRKGSLSGAIYLAAGCSPDFGDNYNLLYGHHMDNDAMFGGLDRYKGQAYFDRHREGLLVTGDAVYDLTVFGSVSTHAYDSLVYDTGSRDLAGIIDLAREGGLPFDASLEGGDKVLALSTCASASTDGRIIVLAYMRERKGGAGPGESGGPDESRTEPEESVRPEEGGQPVGDGSGSGEDASEASERDGSESGGAPSGDSRTTSVDGGAAGSGGSSTPDGGGAGDGGTSTPDGGGAGDGGASSADRGMAEDSGVLEDSGTSSEDSGVLEDSGTSSEDSGVSEDSKAPSADSGGDGKTDGSKISIGEDVRAGTGLGGWLAGIFAGFKPGAEENGGHVWALVNLIAMLLTIYLFLPLGFIRPKFRRRKLLEDYLEQLEDANPDAGSGAEGAAGASPKGADAAGEASPEGAAAAAGGLPEDAAAEREDPEDSLKRFKRKYFTGVALEPFISLLAILAFLYTEDLRLPMVLIDRYTPLMLLILLICWIADFFLVRNRDVDISEADAGKTE